MLTVIQLPFDLFTSPLPSVLRQVAEPVQRLDATLRRVTDELWETLDALGAGGGLAAPQVGIPLRMFVVDIPEFRHPCSCGGDEDHTAAFTPIRACVVNPTVTWTSCEHRIDRESCYSLPGYRGLVSRPREVMVDAWSERGAATVYRLNGWPARVFLHELDHLDGVLYSDRATEALERLEEVSV